MKNFSALNNKIRITAIIAFSILATILMTTAFSSFADSNDPTLISASYDIDTEVISTFNLETVSFVPSETDEYLDKDVHGDIGSRTELHHFFDCNGLYNIAYSDEENVYVDRLNQEFDFVESITIPKIYPMLGDIVCDNDGNIYIVWGKTDVDGAGEVSTLAVSRHDYSGKKISVVEYYTEGGEDSFDCLDPFKDGGCHAIVTSNKHLVCAFSKLMYNGYRANGIIDLDLLKMQKQDRIKNYVAHSLDQRVAQLSDGGICIVNKGNAFPRGFMVDFYLTDRENDVAFHFFGALGDDNVKAQLAGVVEMEDNVFLVGSSARSLTVDSDYETQNLFIQLVGDKSKQLEGSTNRFGTAGTKYVRDHNIVWLTRCIAPYTVTNPQVVAIDSTRFVVMWEELRMDANGIDSEYIQSYYMIIGADGSVIRDKDALNVRLNTHEDPIYHCGSIYWSTAGYVDTVNKEVYSGGIFHDAIYYRLADVTTVKCYKLTANTTGEKTLTAPELLSVTPSARGVALDWKRVMSAPKYKILRDDGDGTWMPIAVTTNTYFVDTDTIGGKTYRYTVCCTDDSGKEYTSPYDHDGLTVISTSFEDVAVGSWYEKAVTFCVVRSMFNGTAPNIFSPNIPMTRAMFVQVLYSLEGSPDIELSDHFEDVENDKWYARAVEWAYTTGITGGVSETEFKPSACATREQLATFILAYAKYKGINTATTMDLSNYIDEHRISTWSRPALEWAVKNKLISGTSTATLSPQGIATRAQAATMFKTFQENVIETQ